MHEKVRISASFSGDPPDAFPEFSKLSDIFFYYCDYTYNLVDLSPFFFVVEV